MKKVLYEKIFIDDDLPLRQKLLDITGAMTVPITTNGKDYVIGWDVQRLNALIAS
jgi:hypothetical protein